MLTDHPSPKPKAFTLMEIVLCLAILIVLAAIALPRFGLSAVRYQADLAAQRIVTDLELAQQAAKSCGTSKTIEFYPDDDQYQIDGVTLLSGNQGSYRVTLNHEPYYTDLASVTFGSGTTLVFNGWGLPDAGGSIVLTTGTETRTLHVDSETGTIEIE